MKRLFVYILILFTLFIINSCADAGKDQTVYSGDKVVLDGSASTPRDGWEIIKYRWRQVKGKKVELENRNSIKATFIAPKVKKKRRLVFQLTTVEKSPSGYTIKSKDRVNIFVKPKEGNNDTTPPVITIKGDNPYTLEAGNTFNDPGAEAIDETDGTVAVNTSGEVNSKVVGEYTIYYSAKDKSGNEANATRVVNVIDTTSPTIKILGDNPLILEYGSSFSDPGVKTSDNAEGNITVTKEGSVDTHTLGDYNITYTATDASGNEAKAIRVVKVIDSTPPIITLNGDKNISLFVGDEYKELGATAIDNVDGELNVTIRGQVDTNKEGNYTITYSAVDSSGNKAEAKRYVEVKKKPVSLQSIVISPQTIELRVKGEASFKILGNLSDGTQKELISADLSLEDSSLALVENNTLKGLQEGNTTLRAIYKNFSATANVRVYKELNTSNFNSAEFGSEYTDTIPPNATKDNYDQKRFCMITGRVVDENNQPLEGVKVWLLHHKEYGSVSTDSNGTFALPSEGGVNYIIRYQKDGYLIADREFSAPIQDWVVVKEVQLLPKDEKATQIDLNASKVQVHKSTPTVDDRGERSTTLVFNGVSKATVTEADGTVRELKSFKVRATEFKTLKSMPKELPKNSAFTFCSDLTIDGVSDDANVSFDKPVVMYVDNFLGFKIGEIVPIGYYDRKEGKWKPSKNGVVVKLLDTNNDGKIDALDSDGDNQPNDLNGDGSFSDEVAGIADKDGYEAGKTYWRGEITHFTPWDFNWPYAPPPGAKPPALEDPDVDTPPKPEADCKAYGFSYVTVKGRVFHEDIPIAGTNLSLHYASDRVGSFKYAITANINTDEMPDSVYAARVEIFVAGQYYKKELHRGDDGHIEYVWNGKDKLGRRVSGKVKAIIEVTYLYPLVMYSASSDYQYAWNQVGGASTKILGREKIEYSVSKTIDIEVPRKKKYDIGNGWSINGIKTDIKKDKYILNNPLTTVAGNGNKGYNGDNKEAIKASLGLDDARINGIAVDTQGNIYISDTYNNRIRKIDTNGVISTIAGTGEAGFSGDGDLAINAKLNRPLGLTIDNKGNIYFVDNANFRVRKIDSSGIITTIAGNGYRSSGKYKGIATEIPLSNPQDVAIDKEGNLYITDTNNHVIRKVDSSGYLTTIAGKFNRGGVSGDNGLAKDAYVGYPYGITVDNDDNIYFTDYQHHIARKIDKYGIITTIAGDEKSRYNGDGLLATKASLNYPMGIAVDGDNNVYISDRGNLRIRKIDEKGIISTVAGNGHFAYNGDSGYARDINLHYPNAVAIDVYGDIYIADAGHNRIRKVKLRENFYKISSNYLVHINNNNTMDIYDKSGKKIKILNLQTGKTLKKYEYDENNHLTAITDQFNQTTQIIRDERGYPTQIIAPNGQVTNLMVDSNGDLVEVAYEDGSKYQFSYYEGSLLKDMVDLGGHTIGHYYNKLGRFIKETLPNGGAYEFARSKEGNTTTYTQTFPEGEQRVIKDTKLANGDINSTITLPSGDKVYVNYKNNYFNIESLSNGVKSVLNYTTDSFSKEKTLSNKTITMPSGLSKTTSYNTTYDGNDTVINIKTQTITTNSKTTTITTNYQEGVESITSPMGKTITRSFDIDTLLTKELKFNNLEPINYTYNDKGQITQVTQGDRSVSITYDSRGNIASITNPLGLTTTYEYDNMDRVTKTTYPNNISLSYSYDSYGNIIKRVIPTNKEHKFTYNFASNPTKYIAPTNTQTTYAYDRANRLTKIIKPDGSKIDYIYTKGILSQIVSPNQTINYTYSFNDIVSKIDDGNIELNFSYDGNLLTKATDSYTQSEISYTYNNDFLINSITYAGKKEDIAYNLDSEVISIGSYQINRDSNGFVSKVNDSNYQKEYSYNSYGEVTQIKDNTLTINLTRNRLSQIVRKEEIINNKTTVYEYVYDKLGRLTKVTKDGALAEEYTYDENSNRISAKVYGKSITATYNNLDQLINYNNTSHTYDNNGNLIKKETDTNQTTYSYDDFNNLKEVTLPDSKTISYITNPLNQRVAKLVNGKVAEKYLWKDLTTLLAVYDKDNNLIYRFEYANNRLPIAMTDKNNNKYYLHYDQVGSLRAITGTSGNIIKEITYDSYGNIINDSNPNFKVPFGFAGGLYDSDTKLVHFGYREYDPETGRWLSKDPLLFGGEDSNLYGYVLQDPVNLVDPEGLMSMRVPKWLIRNPRTGIKRNPSKINPTNINPKDTSTWPTPPGKGPFRPGLPSRTKPRNRGEKSLYDSEGGEWRPHLPDEYHDKFHWDYKPPGKNQPWQDVYPEICDPNLIA